MENTPTQANRLAQYSYPLKISLVVVTLLFVVGWSIETPPGLLGKADALAYAVCHRITTHSFTFGDQQMPLCARCTGMYLGALFGMGYLSLFGKRAGLPPLKILIVFAAMLVAFAIDGANSYLHFFPFAAGLYEPENWLRLVTGTGVGLGIAAVLMPVVNQTLWQAYDQRPILPGWKEFLPLLGVAALIDLAVLSEQAVLLYPLGLLSGLGIVLVLSLVYTVIWLMITKQENRYQSYRGLWSFLVAGFLTAMVQIAVLDAGRFWLTGTWAGFKL